MRYFVEISYHGKNYHGWQIQPNAISVQAVLENALSLLLQKEIKITGAGRTDTGVHARQIFAHFDLDEPINDHNEIVHRLNSFLPKDIAINTIFQVNDDAHARFSATNREYQYMIALGKDPFTSELAYKLNASPNVDLMNQAAKTLLGHQDFQCFSRSKTDVKTYYCTINNAVWKLQDKQLIFTISADRFLRNMVRAIVGTLLEIGFGKLSLSQMEEIIKSKDRSRAGASAPAHGLYLTKVEYPKEIFSNK